MTRDQLLDEVHEMRGAAAVRYYARQQCPHLTPNFVETMLTSLGEISIDEAIVMLDREEALAAAHGPQR